MFCFLSCFYLNSVKPELELGIHYNLCLIFMVQLVKKVMIKKTPFLLFCVTWPFHGAAHPHHRALFLCLLRVFVVLCYWVIWINPPIHSIYIDSSISQSWWKQSAFGKNIMFLPFIFSLQYMLKCVLSKTCLPLNLGFIISSWEGCQRDMQPFKIYSVRSPDPEIILSFLVYWENSVQWRQTRINWSGNLAFVMGYG